MELFQKDKMSTKSQALKAIGVNFLCKRPIATLITIKIKVKTFTAYLANTIYTRINSSKASAIFCNENWDTIGLLKYLIFPKNVFGIKRPFEKQSSALIFTGDVYSHSIKWHLYVSAILNRRMKDVFGGKRAQNNYILTMSHYL